MENRAVVFLYRLVAAPDAGEKDKLVVVCTAGELVVFVVLLFLFVFATKMRQICDKYATNVRQMCDKRDKSATILRQTRTNVRQMRTTCHT
jgi:hypothetical protein